MRLARSPARSSKSSPPIPAAPPALVETAKEILIRRRDTQFDSLTKRLRKNRFVESYLDRIEQAMGWLAIFDRRQNAPVIADRLKTEIVETATGKKITVIRA